MEPEFYQVLLWLYQENLWLYMIYTLQRELFFEGEG